MRVVTTSGANAIDHYVCFSVGNTSSRDTSIATLDDAMTRMIREALCGLSSESTLSRLVMVPIYAARNYALRFGLMHNYDAKNVYCDGDAPVHILIVDGVVIPHDANEMATLVRVIDACARKRHAALNADVAAGRMQARTGKLPAYRVVQSSFVLHVISTHLRHRGTVNNMRVTHYHHHGGVAVPLLGSVCSSDAWRRAVHDWPALISTLTDVAELHFGVRTAYAVNGCAGPGLGKLKADAMLGASSRRSNAENGSTAEMGGGRGAAATRELAKGRARTSTTTPVLASILDRYGWKKRKAMREALDDRARNGVRTVSAAAVAPAADADDIMVVGPGEIDKVVAGIDIASLFSVTAPLRRGTGGETKCASLTTSLSLVPSSLDRGHIADMRVIGQFANKFIVGVSRGVLLVVDQHAADERIKLEDFQTAAFSTHMMTENAANANDDIGAGARRFPSAPVLLPTELVLGASECVALLRFRDKMRYWGWEWEESGDGAPPPPSPAFESGSAVRGSSATRVIRLKRVPLLLGMKILGHEPFRQYLLELQDIGGALRPPSSFHNLLSSKACRQAIMFGDMLTSADMRAIIGAVARTKLPFMCAHGRPTTAPLLNLAVADASIASVAVRRRGESNRPHTVSMRARRRRDDDGGHSRRRRAKLRQLVNEIAEMCE